MPPTHPPCIPPEDGPESVRVGPSLSESVGVGLQAGATQYYRFRYASEHAYTDLEDPSEQLSWSIRVEGRCRASEPGGLLQ